MDTTWDAIVIGGGAAGLSAALVLGRARRRTLVLDAGGQGNRVAHAVGGLLGQEGTSPEDLYSRAREQLGGYPSVALRDAIVAGGGPATDGGFALSLADGELLRARRVLLAPGMDYVLPALPGVRELWGRSVFHCPYCHGWEVRDRALAVLAAGDAGLHASLLLRGWSDDVVLLTDGPAGLGDAARAQLAAAGVAIVERPLAWLRAERGELAAVAFADGGPELARDALLVRAPLRQRSDLAEALGATLTPHGAVQVDAFGWTGVDGLFAAGDAAAMIQQVAGAIGDGARAAVFLNHSLVAAEHGLPFPPQPPPAAE